MPDRSRRIATARSPTTVTGASLLPFGRTVVTVKSAIVNPMLPFRVNTGRSRRRDPFPSPQLRICGRVSTSPPGRSTPARPGLDACRRSSKNSQSGFVATGTCAGHAASGRPGQGTAGQANPASPRRRPNEAAVRGPGQSLDRPQTRPSASPPPLQAPCKPPASHPAPIDVPTASHLATTGAGLLMDPDA